MAPFVLGVTSYGTAMRIFHRLRSGNGRRRGGFETRPYTPPGSHREARLAGATKRQHLLGPRRRRRNGTQTMAKVIFTPNLQRHVLCPQAEAPGRTVREVLDNVFAANARARSYVLDDQA